MSIPQIVLSLPLRSRRDSPADIFKTIIDYFIPEVLRKRTPNLLEFLLNFIGLGPDAQVPDLENPDVAENLEVGLGQLGNYLLVNLFLPFSRKGRQDGEDGEDREDSEDRDNHLLRDLHKHCLKRDGYRCAVSGTFDQTEYLRRRRELGGRRPKDDDNVSVTGDSTDIVDCISIIPRRLLKAKKDNTWAEAKLHALLALFDAGMLAEMQELDEFSPKNTLVLAPEHAYRVKDFVGVVEESGKDINFRQSPEEVEMPSFRLLQFHCKVAAAVVYSGAVWELDG
ncbi:hypothetical protein V8F33_008731 [Rhypophila sp. PSN 637]